jgi:tape measure domain-containing protein
VAVVSERLEITDAFSAVFQRFNTMADRISNSLERIDNNLDQYINTNNRARQSTRDHGEQARKTSTDMTALAGTVGKLVAAFGGMAAIKGLVNLSDELTQTQARLDSINDGLQTSEQLNKMIFASAQNARGSYLDMAQNVAALKAQTGDVFKSTAEAVRFTELLNKQFSISGTSASGVASTMYNLTQALATGVLRGNDLQMVLSNSPALVQRISQYMGITVGELRELASQGKITADIVKNAIMSAGDDIDAQFNKMPMTFGQAMQKVKNTAIMGFQPVGQAIANAINSPEFDQAISAISQGILAVTLVGLKGFEALGRVAKFASDNFKTIAPILGIILAAVVAYNAAVAISTGIEAAHAAVTALITGAKTAYSLAVAIATGNQVAFNAALQACPIVWIIDAIVAAIAVVVALIMVFHNLAQTGHTVFGDVAGVVLGCFAVIQNALAIVANGFISAAEWIANAWNDMVFNIQTFFYNLAVSAINVFNSVIDAADGAATAIANAFISGINQAIGAINTLVDALNNIPGFSLGHVGTVGSVSSVISGRISTAGLTAPTKAAQVSFGRFETQSFGDAFKSGFDQGSAWGDSVQNDLMSGFNGIKEQFNSLMGGSSLGDIASGMDGLGEAAGAGAGGSGGGGKGKTNVGTVDKVKDVTLSDEDLKIYKDLAEQRYMANVELQTLAPNISVSIPESAAKNLTSEDVANKLKVMLIEQMASHTAVSHAR